MLRSRGAAGGGGWAEARAIGAWDLYARAMAWRAGREGEYPGAEELAVAGGRGGGDLKQPRRRRWLVAVAPVPGEGKYK